MTRQERNTISKVKHTTEIVHFALHGVEEVMKNLGVERYVIGGSVASILHGIDIERIPHDVDVIVPKGMSKYIECMVNNSMYYIARPGTSSIDDEFHTKHFAFTAIKFPCRIDIIEDITGIEQFNVFSYKIADLKTLIAAKKHYHRAKDSSDLKKLEELFNKCSAKEGKAKTDVDALAELKARMNKEA